MRSFFLGTLILGISLPALAEEASYNNTNPAISPDGRYVAFYSDRNGSDDEFVLDLETGELRALSTSDLPEYGPTWSPDGQTVYFYGGENSRMEVFRVGLEEGARVEQVTGLGGYVSNPQVSPDGRELLFSWNEGVFGNDYEIFVMDLKTGALTQLTDNEANEYTAVWSPDGSKIAFNSSRNDNQFDVYIMDASGRNQQKVADLNPHDYYAEWTPDGQWVAFFSGPDFDHFDAYKANIETGEVVRLTEGMGTGKVSFCPDGSCLIFGADSPEGARLYISGPNGENPRLLPGQ